MEVIRAKILLMLSRNCVSPRSKLSSEMNFINLLFCLKDGLWNVLSDGLKNIAVYGKTVKEHSLFLYKWLFSLLFLYLLGDFKQALTNFKAKSCGKPTISTFHTPILHEPVGDNLDNAFQVWKNPHSSAFVKLWGNLIPLLYLLYRVRKNVSRAIYGTFCRITQSHRSRRKNNQ